MKPALFSDPLSSPHGRRHGFSLVEVLAAVAIIGVITFLAIPNIVQVKGDSEEQLAIARAEALNMAMATYVQNQGSLSGARSAWQSMSDTARFTNLAPYLSFAETNRSNFMPPGYSFTMPTNLLASGTNGKVTLRGPSSNIISY